MLFYILRGSVLRGSHPRGDPGGGVVGREMKMEAGRAVLSPFSSLALLFVLGAVLEGCWGCALLSRRFPRSSSLFLVGVAYLMGVALPCSPHGRYSHLPLLRRSENAHSACATTAAIAVPTSTYRVCRAYLLIVARAVTYSRVSKRSELIIVYIISPRPPQFFLGSRGGSYNIGISDFRNRLWNKW